ncbi:MAG: hypothetical protein WCD76_14855 [Pyrinomonadaceae bacterium]
MSDDQAFLAQLDQLRGQLQRLMAAVEVCRADGPTAAEVSARVRPSDASPSDYQADV